MQRRPTRLFEREAAFVSLGTVYNIRGLICDIGTISNGLLIIVIHLSQQHMGIEVYM